MKKAIYLFTLLSLFGCGLGKQHYQSVKYINESDYSIKIKSYDLSNNIETITLNKGDYWQSKKIDINDGLYIKHPDVLNADSIVIWFDDNYISYHEHENIETNIFDIDNYFIEIVDDYNEVYNYIFTNEYFK